jgi:hypothetical protein
MGGLLPNSEKQRVAAKYWLHPSGELEKHGAKGQVYKRSIHPRFATESNREPRVRSINATESQGSGL